MTSGTGWITGDAEAFTRDFLPLFRPVPPARPGVCRICRSGPDNAGDTGGPRGICGSCERTTKNLYGHARHVIPISLTTTNAQLHDVLVRRRDPVGAGGRRRRADFLAATVAHFYDRHSRCLEGLAGGPFTLVATVPGNDPETPATAFHLMWQVVEKVPALARLWRPLLLEPDTAFAPVLAGRRSHRDAFLIPRADRLSAARVLLVDDLFVSGAHVQSAASALIEMGAEAVVALVIARLINPASRDGHGTGLWEESCQRPFSFDRCCVCDPAAHGAA
ncbi:hypothetical protein [Nonomuraea jiangxiensis]|uniref:Amidophosphoribosyltransferase n=1 Tax=Nonomuraea jiangxiensis TaxID=633440 RepID=A0A1G9NAG9_9ACTN|nr:hypothetical protein [Nonomuraea jiangxiensis]SDL83516.1 hypothetical protein SAMN05421869_13188 [Nonomuraea jiangxiensis]